MHEYSIVQALLEQIEELALQNSATKVTKVVTKIGMMSGVEPHLLEVAFETFKEKSICDEAVFVMNIKLLTLECKSCNEQTQTQKAHYACQKCGSLDVVVIDGEEMYLMSLEME